MRTNERVRAAIAILAGLVIGLGAYGEVIPQAVSFDGMETISQLITSQILISGPEVLRLPVGSSWHPGLQTMIIQL